MKVANELGWIYTGLNGRSHYSFTKDDAVVTTPSTPRDPDMSLKAFRRDLERGYCRGAW